MEEKKIRILAIESSCDETACAVVENGRKVCSNVIASQAKLHARFGGVVPELASRMHIEALLPVIEECLKKANLSMEDIDYVAATSCPGLVGSLLVGLCAAKSLAFAYQKPFVPVHHIAGHIASNYLENEKLQPPFLSLVVSGGHTQLIYVKDYTSFEVVGTTRDDAAGEAFDKIARVLGLAYPGGPSIDKLAQKGNPKAFTFPKVKFKEENKALDYSFSGVKTAALSMINQWQMKAKEQGKDWKESLCLEDFAASYQQNIVEVLLDHAKEAMKKYAVSTLALAGGVSANSALRKYAQEIFSDKEISLHFPSLAYCTDNAAMIASMAYFQLLKADFSEKATKKLWESPAGASVSLEKFYALSKEA